MTPPEAESPADRGERPLAASATAHAVAAYLPEPERARSGVALALSGGGFRAALFHLGALRRLNELGALSRIDTISSVSGGSILSAHLAERIGDWPAGGEVVDDWDGRVAKPFYAFAKRNIRTGPLLRRALPWNWRRGSASARALADIYQRRLTGLRLRQLPAPPARPRLIFCSSDLTFGVNWVFDSAARDDGVSRAGDYQAGYARPMPDWPLARAVAASSCFPPVFDPLEGAVPAAELVGGKYKKADRDRLVEEIRLSDGGATFDPVRLAGVFWRAGRYTSVVENQARGLRKRWLITGFLRKEFFGTYWGVGTPADRYEEQADGSRRQYHGYAEPFVDDCVSEVRTDLDAFSDGEIAVLENHGYLLAEAAVKTHVPDLIAGDAPLVVPHERFMDEATARAALATSSKRKLLGRRR